MTVMWRRPELSDQPEKLLTSAFASGPGCSTRRSAGFPFLIQGVLATAPPGNKGLLLTSTLGKLFAMATDRSSLEVRLTAYNILRVLFRDASLGDTMASKAGDGLVLAIDGFKAASWSVSQLIFFIFVSVVLT